MSYFQVSCWVLGLFCLQRQGQGTSTIVAPHWSCCFASQEVTVAGMTRDILAGMSCNINGAWLRLERSPRSR